MKLTKAKTTIDLFHQCNLMVIKTLYKRKIHLTLYKDTKIKVKWQEAMNKVKHHLIKIKILNSQIRFYNQVT